MDWVQKTRKLLKGRTLRSIEKVADWSPNTLAATLSKASVPTATRGIKLARALGVDPDWLFDDEQAWPPPETTDEDSISVEDLDQLLRTLLDGAVQVLAVASEYHDPNSPLAKRTNKSRLSVDEFRKRIRKALQGPTKKKTTKKRRSNGTGKRA